MRKKLYALYLCLGLALVNYQSCAPSSEVLQEDSLQADQASVDVIDQIQMGEIAFPQSKIDVFVDSSVVIGICEQSGSLISWQLLDENENVVDRGLAPCDQGAFEVELGSQWQSHCDEALVLSAALGAKASSEIEIQANCQ